MPLRIIRNDITKVEADAIVNTANPEPVVGSGTDRAIHAAAGPELLATRERIGRIGVGESAATPAFGLRAKYVLHTVSPVWIDGAHQEEELLRKAYDAALQQAEELGCASVAFPLMAAGSYGFPRDLALSVAVGAFTDFLPEHEMEICLVLFNAEAFGIAGSIFDDLKSYIDDNYVSAKNEEEYPDEMHSAGTAAARRYAMHEQMREPGMREESVHASHVRPTAKKPRTAGQKRTEISQRREKEGRREVSEEMCMPHLMQESKSAEMGRQHPVQASKAAAQSLEDIFKQREATFSEYLLDLLRERDGKDSEVYKRAEVSKQLFSKILNNRDYQPTKSTAIQLALGLQLDLAQTQKLLGKAGYALTRSSKADLVVQYYIERRIYSVTFINEALFDCGLPLLKTGLKS